MTIDDFLDTLRAAGIAGFRGCRDTPQPLDLRRRAPVSDRRVAEMDRYCCIAGLSEVTNIPQLQLWNALSRSTSIDIGRSGSEIITQFVFDYDAVLQWLEVFGKTQYSRQSPVEYRSRSVKRCSLPTRCG